MKVMKMTDAIMPWVIALSFLAVLVPIGIVKVYPRYYYEKWTQHPGTRVKAKDRSYWQQTAMDFASPRGVLELAAIAGLLVLWYKVGF